MLSGFLLSQVSLSPFPLVRLLSCLISLILPVSFRFVNPLSYFFFLSFFLFFPFLSSCLHFLLFPLISSSFTHPSNSYSILSLHPLSCSKSLFFSSSLHISSLFSLHSSPIHCPVLSPLLFFPCCLHSFLVLSFNPICPWSHAGLQMG